MKESPEALPGSVLLDFKQHLGSILSRVEQRKAKLDILANLYEFYDSVSKIYGNMLCRDPGKSDITF